MSDDAIEIPIRLADDQAQLVLQQLRERAALTGQGIQQDLGGGATGATDALGKLREALVAHRTEATQAYRATTLFSRELSGILGPGNEVVSVLAELGGGLVGGVGIGLAFEAAKIAIHAFTAENAVLVKELTEVQRSVDQVTKELKDKWQSYWDDLARKGQKYVADSIGAQEQRKLVEQKVDIEAKIRHEQGIVAEMDQDMLAWTWQYGFRSSHLKQIEALEIQHTRIMAGVQQNATQETEGRTQEQARKDTEEREKRHSEIVAKAQQLHREAVLGQLDERTKIEQALAFQVHDLEAYGTQDKATREAIYAAREIAAEKVRKLDLDLDAKLAQAREQAAQEELAATVKKEAAKIQAEQDAAFLREAHGNEAEARQLESLQKHYRDLINAQEDNLQEQLRLQQEYETKKQVLLDNGSRHEVLTLRSYGMGVSQYALQAGNAFRQLQQVEQDKTEATVQGSQLSIEALDGLGQAVEMFAQGNIQAIAEQAGVEAIMNTAKGLAALAMGFLGMPSAPAAASAYFSAAAMDAAIAGVAGGLMLAGVGGGSGASALGGGSALGSGVASSTNYYDSHALPGGSAGGGSSGSGGGASTSGYTGNPAIDAYLADQAKQKTQQDQAELAKLAAEIPGLVDQLKNAQELLAATTPNSVGNLTFSVLVSALQDQLNKAIDEYKKLMPGSPSSSLTSGSTTAAPAVIRETVFLVGDPFETPAETARRAQRRLDLAKSLDMARRTG